MSSCVAKTEIVQPIPVSVHCRISSVLLLLHADCAVIKASLGGWMPLGDWK